MDKKIVIGVGEFLWDITPTGKRAGGAPVNFAYHASCDEVEGWAVSAVGKDGLGRELLTVAKEKGIRLLVAEVDRPTGTVDVILNNGQPDFHIHENVAWDYIPLTDELLKKASSASAIPFGTLAQRSPVSRATTQALLKAASESSWKVYDINLRQKFWSKELIEESLQLANVIHSRVILCNLCGSLSHAKANFHYNGICVIEQLGKVKCSVLKRYAPDLMQFVITASLAFCHASCTDYISFYCTAKK